MNTSITHQQREVFVLRRMLWLYLPALTAAMAVYLVSFALTTTINGLGLFAIAAAGAVVFIAALDARADR